MGHLQLRWIFREHACLRGSLFVVSSFVVSLFGDRLIQRAGRGDLGNRARCWRFGIAPAIAAPPRQRETSAAPRSSTAKSRRRPT